MLLDILIIDDDKVDREAVKRYLRSPAHHTITFHEAETGTEALEILQSRTFDCVLLDYLLPDMDGVSLLKQIYNADTDIAISPLVMLTGQGNEAVMLDALRRGAQDYLIKDHISSDTLNIAITKAREIFELKKSQKQAQDKLHQFHKLEAIGQLTSGVAHDFNNLLTVIMGNTRILQKRLRGDQADFSFEDASVKIQAIETAAKMGADLVTRLMVFARQRPLTLQTANINECVDQTFELIKRALGEEIGVNLILTDNLWPVALDITQFGNALINISLNARDAMPKGGKLTIETSNIILDDAYAESRPDISPGPHVLIAISDTGSGMGPDIIKHIFEPFFTTKPIGEGTGLGLPMIYGFITQSGGHITVYSEEGHGTVFRIYLPALSIGENSQVESAEDLLLHSGKETILIAEDDEDIRHIAKIILDRLGYQTIEAENGRVALEIFKRNPEKIDAIFTDIVMPDGIGGIDLIREAREIKPDIKALYTSGYTEKAFPDYRLDPGVSLISKPYHKKELAQKIRHILDN